MGRSNFTKFKIISLPATTSTNTYIKGRIDELPENSVVIADIQTDGKGRLGNKWIADKGALSMSVLFKNISSAQNLTVLTLGAFKNCIALKTIDMPSLIEIGANAVRNTGIEDFSGTTVEKIGNYAFADNYYLEKAYFPVATSTGTNVFLNCSSLQIVGLLSLEELNGNTFSNCPSLINLYLPNAVSVVKSAFKGSSVEILRFEKIETIKDLPTTLKALIFPNTTSSVTAFLS